MLKALAKDPHERFESTGAFSKALEEAFLAQEAIGPSIFSSDQAELSPAVSSTQQTNTHQAQGTLLFKFPCDANIDCNLAWSPDSNIIAYGNSRGIVQAWSISDQRKIFEHSGHSGVNAVLVTPDGNFILSAGDEGTVQRWDIKTNRKILTYRGHTDSVEALSLAPSGKYFVSGSRDNTVIIWAIDNSIGQSKYRGHNEDVVTLAWSPNSTLIVSGDNRQSIQVWDASTMEEVYTKYQSTHKVNWSPDGSYISSAGGSFNFIQIWHPYSGMVKSSYNYAFSADHPIQMTSRFTWSPNGKSIACVVSIGRKLNNNTVHFVADRIDIWDIASEQPYFRYEGHSGSITDICWAPNGKYIASCSYDGTIHIWQAL